MELLPIVTYAAAAVFIIAVVARFMKFKNMPIHLRWELYPVAHEKGKSHYGGSFLEEFEWWTKPRESSLLGELKVMIPEIILLVGVWEHNKSQWLRSFPFHFGLYMLVGLIALLFAGGIAQAAGATIGVDGSGLGIALHHVTYIVGWIGLVLALLGSLGLLLRRMFNVNYSEYTKGADYFNLVFFVATLVAAVIAHATVDPYFIGLRNFYQQLVSFSLTQAGSGVPAMLAAEIVLGSVLVAYIPLTHMSHFFTKWFMYHDIRWNDTPNMRGSEIEKKVGEVLQYPVSWAAPHIGADGKKNWVDVATSGVEVKE